MFETLYRSAKPKTFVEGGEYYQPSLDVEMRDGKPAYFVREKHGFWNEEEKRVANHTVTLSPDEGFATWAEAEDRYTQQVAKRAAEGFIHSFSIDPTKDNPVVYRQINLSSRANTSKAK